MLMGNQLFASYWGVKQKVKNPTLLLCNGVSPPRSTVMTTRVFWWESGRSSPTECTPPPGSAVGTSCGSGPRVGRSATASAGSLLPWTVPVRSALAVCTSGCSYPTLYQFQCRPMSLFL